MSDNMVVLPGERCRKAREALGWTPAEAAKKMHLSQSYLVALEADDYERLPEATFVKGYLKNYARLLGLPADEIANTFQQIVNDDAFDKPLDLPKMAPPPSVWHPGQEPPKLFRSTVFVALRVTNVPSAGVWQALSHRPFASS